MTQPIRPAKPSRLIRKLRKLGNEPKQFFIDSSGFQIAHRSWQQSLKLGSFLWVLACFAAYHFGGEVGQALFSSSIGDAGLRGLAGCAVVFVGVLVVMAIGRLAASGMIKALGMGVSDRLLGLVFGVARGVLIAMVLVAVGGMTSAPKQPWWSNAMLAQPMEIAVMAVLPWLPPDVAKRIRFK